MSVLLFVVLGLLGIWSLATGLVLIVGPLMVLLTQAFTQRSPRD